MLRAAIRITLLLATALPAAALEAGFSGRASSWLTARHDTSLAAEAGARYIPVFTLAHELGPASTLGLELSADALVRAGSRDIDSVDFELDLEPYRAWLRFSTAQFESRVGLQRIIFGPAAMLRPLMWFDAVDARDPLRLTTGVYGLLLRYFFLDNTNVWAWGLLGNDEPRGWEALASKRWIPELGGRVQLPVPVGEVGASYHFRRAELPWQTRPGMPEVVFEPDEHRWGLDGKWDIGVGAWFEAVVGYDRFGSDARALGVDTLYPSWRRAATLGADYTFGFGNGIGVIVEHLRLENATGPLRDAALRVQLSALSVGYPLGLVDNLHAIVYYDWENRDLYRTLSWQRTYDRWSWNVMAFWNPDRASAQYAGPVSGGMAGKGMQLLATYNH